MKCASCHTIASSTDGPWRKLTIWLRSLRTNPRTDPLRQTDGQGVDGEMDFPGIRQDRSEGSEGGTAQAIGRSDDPYPENGRFTRTIVNRIWARLMGRGIVHPVDAMDTKPWNEDLLDYLAVRFAEDGYDLREFIGFVMTSQRLPVQERFSEQGTG